MARTTAEKEKAFALGDKGVNIVSTPLHVEPGELSHAQNVIFSLDRAKHGLTKRPGMAKFNATAAAGSILAIQVVPLPQAIDPDTTEVEGRRLFLFASNAFGSLDNQTQSDDGATWTQPAGHKGAAGNVGFHGHLLHVGASLFLPKADSADPAWFWVGAFESFDGVTWADVFTLPNVVVDGETYVPYQLLSADQDTLNFYYLSNYQNITPGYAGPLNLQFVHQVEQTAYAITQLGQGFSPHATLPSGSYLHVSEPTSLAIFDGEVWIVGHTVVGSYHAARVWDVLPDGATWTQDMTLGGTGTSSDYLGYGSVGHGDYLWCSWASNDSNTKTILRRRTSVGVWSTIYEGTVNGFEYIYPLYALGDDMYFWFEALAPLVGYSLYRTEDAGVTFTKIGEFTDDQDPASRGIRWKVNGRVYCYTTIAYDSDDFRIWELTFAAIVLGNTVGTMFPGQNGLIGAAGVYGVTGAPPALVAPVPIDPVLPIAPTSLMAKASVYLTTTTSIPAYNERPLFFDTATFNVGTMWVSGQSVLTVPYGGAGYYLMTGQVAWDNNAGSRDMRANLYLNGSPIAREMSGFNWNVSANYVFGRTSALVYLNDGDKIEVHVLHQNYGTPINIIGGASNTFLHVFRLL